jgi:hypothetical protein
VWLEGLGKLKKFIHIIGSRTSDLKASSVGFPYASVIQYNFMHDPYTPSNARRNPASEILKLIRRVLEL